jgi:autophagy-related protein 101
MSAQLTTCFLNIIRFINDKKDHIPPITTLEANPFPFQVCIYNTIF